MNYRYNSEKSIIGKAIAAFLIIILIIVLGWVLIAGVIVKVADNVDTRLEQNDTTLSKETGRFFSNIVSDFKEGAEEAKENNSSLD